MRPQPQSFRSATATPATLKLDDGTSVPCVIRNLSAGGAQIELGATDALPDRFQILAQDLHVNAEAHVIWRRDSLVGIRFAMRQNTAATRAADTRTSSLQHAIGLAHITSADRKAAVQ